MKLLKKKIKEENSRFYNRNIPADLTLNLHWRKLYDEVKNFLSLDATIADLGCGPGHLARILYEEGYKNYWGVDFAATLIEIARKATPEYKFTVGNLYHKGVQQQFVKYDVFVVLEVLEHLLHDIDVLKAIPTGRLIILSVPNAGGRGHVRWFNTANKVSKRYGSIIDLDEVVRISRPNAVCFWLVSGIRK